MTEQDSPFAQIGFKKFIPAILWFLLVLVLVCLPGKTIPKAGWLDEISFDKLVHAALFGGIVFSICMPFKKAAVERQTKLTIFIKIALATCIWGITTELIQKYFVPGRQFDLYDWAADSLGAIISFFVCRKFFL
jgi:hypothetical protein